MGAEKIVKKLSTYGIWCICRTIYDNSPLTELSIVGQADFHAIRWVLYDVLVFLAIQK